MFYSYDYKKKREVIEFVGEFYDRKRAEIEGINNECKEVILETERLLTMTENKHIIKELKKYIIDVQAKIKSSARADVIHYNRTDFIKLLLKNFDRKDWYNKDIDALKKNMWAYGSY